MNLSLVKWAGGKQQLLSQFKPLFPKTIKRYFEPFVGGGAVAFFIIQEYNPKVFLSDTNEELINTFNVVKTDVELLIAALRDHKEQHSRKGSNYFYAVRALDPGKMSALEQAARFIYLNRTCFNGLYRVNSKGKFNVPVGSYKNPDIVQSDKLRTVSVLLQKAKIMVMSFEKTASLAKKGDFVYFDPPYHPKKNNFTAYTSSNFLEKDQKLLARIFDKLTMKGCLCMQSNSDTELVRKLYSGYNIHMVTAKRLINSRPEGRSAINEVVITNY